MYPLAIGVVQSSNGAVLFLVTSKHMGTIRAARALKSFATEIAVIRKREFAKVDGLAAPAYRDGCIETTDYRLAYTLLHDVHLVIVSHSDDNPFVHVPLLKEGKKILTTAAGGIAVTPTKLQKTQSEIHLALLRLLLGDKGSEVVTQKLLEISPFHNNEKAPEGSEWEEEVARYDESIRCLKDLSYVNITVPSNHMSGSQTGFAGKTNTIIVADRVELTRKVPQRQQSNTPKLSLPGQAFTTSMVVEVPQHSPRYRDGADEQSYPQGISLSARPSRKRPALLLQENDNPDSE